MPSGHDPETGIERFRKGNDTLYIGGYLAPGFLEAVVDLAASHEAAICQDEGGTAGV